MRNYISFLDNSDSYFRSTVKNVDNQCNIDCE